jgi:hypothetical protein
MSFDAKSGILKAINETADASLRTVLLLMLAVFEELGGKLDNVLQNEDSLRHTVLNGHAANHHRDHEWLDRRIQRDAQIEVIVGWAESKIIKERQDEEDARKVKVDVVGKVFGYIAVAALTAAITYLVSK